MFFFLGISALMLLALACNECLNIYIPYKKGEVPKFMVIITIIVSILAWIWVTCWAYVIFENAGILT